MRYAIALTATLAALAPLSAQTPAPSSHRNVIIFVADGLRHGSVTKSDTPALWRVRTEGVHFENSHSVFPTFTTANASAIATGHQLGDTGDFSNTIWTGFATFDTGNFGQDTGTAVPFIENDRIIGDLDDHFGGNYLGEDTLMSLARANGYSTAVIGKVGPVAIQDAAAIAPSNQLFPASPDTVFVDDATGSPAGIPVPLPVIKDLVSKFLPFEAPTRSNGYGATSAYNNGYAGDRTHAGTRAANTIQQQWFADQTTTRVLPYLVKTGRPFALLYWSRDPDASQHNEGDSLGTLFPGINGDTSTLGVKNADANLAELLAWLDANPTVKANTDVFVTSDHGFATIGRRAVDRTGATSAAESAKHDYLDATGAIDTVIGTLPNGFLAIDLAAAMQAELYDPDARPAGGRVFRRVHIDPFTAAWEHPTNGNGYISVGSPKLDGSDARIIVAANGGSDLIYVPDGNADTVERVVGLVTSFDYVGGVFVDDKYGRLAGTLPESAINLVGATKMPRPAVIVAFRTFYTNSADVQTAIQVSDSSLQEGQGMHGGFGRDQTFNNMAAMGPDFKAGFADAAPVGNADITPTLAHILGFKAMPKGALNGRVLSEALADGQTAGAPAVQTLRSAEANGHVTLLLYQEFGGVRYLDAACFVAPAAAACR
jgi:arylsulfatase A-like enzyme